MSDADFSDPNNQLVVTTSGENCLLAPTKTSYDTSNNAKVIVEFQLTQKADYDTMPSPPVIMCDVLIQVSGNDNSRALREISVYYFEHQVYCFSDLTMQYNYVL